MKTAEQWIEEYKNDKKRGNGLKRTIAWTSGDLCRAIQLDAFRAGMTKAAEVVDLKSNNTGNEAMILKHEILFARDTLKELS